MSDQKKRFIGPSEVFGVTILDKKNTNGDDLLEVCYENKDIPTEVMPRKLFEHLISETPYDWNTLRTKRTEILINDIAKICLEHSLRWGDIKYVCLQTEQKLLSAFDRAVNYLWTKDDKQFIPGYEPLSNHTLTEVEEILQGIQKDVKQSSEGEAAENNDGNAGAAESKGN